jgi:hypothetical protein
MSWITITEEDLKTRLSADELAAVRAQIGANDNDPVAGIITAVTNLVRGYVGVQYVTGDVGTIPEKLLDSALSIVCVRLLSRLPMSISQTRLDEKSEALKLLDQVAKGLFDIDEPEIRTTESSGLTGPKISAPDREWTRENQDGL